MINNKQQQINSLLEELRKQEQDDMVATVDYNELERQKKLLEKEVKINRELLEKRREDLKYIQQQLGVVRQKRDDMISEINKMEARKIDLRREIVKNEDTRMGQVQTGIITTMGVYFYNICKRFMEDADKFRLSLPAENRHSFDNLQDETFFRDIARNSDLIIETASNLFLGFLEQAVNIAQSGRGGGQQP